MELKLNELNYENIGIWPVNIKIGVIVITCILLLILGYWFDISNQFEKLTKAQTTEASLKKSLVKKYQLAANLDAYRVQLKQVNSAFQVLLQQLPTSSEIPGLLEDISKTGRAAGLSFKLFKPLPEVQKDFYAELPIKMSVIGNYHQLAEFISDISNLDRIVILHDFSIKYPENNKSEAGDNLILDILAKTYRYTGEVETKVNEVKK